MPLDGERSAAIVAEDIWVKYLVRYRKANLTVRESLIGLFSPSSPGLRSWREEFAALRGVTFTAHPGEVIGLVGANGSGKTTLLKTLAGIIGADSGTLRVRGRVGCLLSFGVGFNPNLTGRENVFLNGSMLGLSKRDLKERIERIIDFSELGEFIHAPVRTYSAGMRARLGFSIAVQLDPDIVLIDEVLGTGDAHFQRKAGTTLECFRAESRTVVIASHSMGRLLRHCTRAIWLERGRIRKEGQPADVVDAYAKASRDEKPAPFSAAAREI